MKFSKKKKKKISSARYKRIKNFYRYCIGCYLDCDKEVIDTLAFQENLYLLTMNSEAKCRIFKVISCNELVELSDNKVLSMQAIFKKASSWKQHTKVEINETGAITKFTLAPKPWEKYDSVMYVLT